MADYAIISLADVKLALDITDTAQDVKLTALIDRLTEVMERELHWYFGPARERTDVMCGTGTPKMFLGGPFLDVTDPYADGFLLECRSYVGDAWETVDAGEYEQRGRRIVRADGWVWLRGVDNFRATYNEGYEEVPGEIEQLALETIASIYRQSGSEGVVSERIGDYSYTLATTLRQIPSFDGVRGSYVRLRIGRC